MKIVRCSWFPPRGFAAITLVWWLIIKDGVKVTSRLINHEDIHCEQQKEMMVLPFFVWYGIEYLFRLLQYRNTGKAYRNISFEREAYENELNMGYLNKRSYFEWINYLKKK